MAMLSVQHEGPAVDPAKRIRNLKKRLGQIEELEDRVRHGAPLEPEQRAKLDSKAAILEEMRIREHFGNEGDM